MASRIFLVLGAVLAAFGVLLGAFHAHGMENWLTRGGVGPEQLDRYMNNAEVAIRYQMIHAVALLVLGSFLASHSTRLLLCGSWALVAGLVLFSGGLYWIAFLGSAIHWSIVPLGGVTMIIAWLVIAVALAVRRQ